MKSYIAFYLYDESGRSSVTLPTPYTKTPPDLLNNRSFRLAIFDIIQWLMLFRDIVCAVGVDLHKCALCEAVKFSLECFNDATPYFQSLVLGHLNVKLIASKIRPDLCQGSAVLYQVLAYMRCQSFSLLRPEEQQHRLVCLKGLAARIRRLVATWVRMLCWPMRRELGR